MKLVRVSALSALLALGFTLTSSPAAFADWRDGPCQEGEGQTVILDWRVGATGSDATQLVRCILMDMTAPAYPETSPAAPLADVLVSAGLKFSAPAGLISQIHGISAALPLYWHFSTGDVTEEGGLWWGDSLWSPEPTANFVGISITDGTDNAPALIPHYEPAPEPPASPSPTPTSDGTPGPSSSPSPTSTEGPAASPSPGPNPSPRPESPAQPEPTAEPEPTPSPAQEPTQDPSKRPSSGPTRSTTATPPPTPPVTPPPSADPSTTPSPTQPQRPATPSTELSPLGEMGPRPSPQPVWGNEGVRHSVPSTLDDGNSPWVSFNTVVLGLGLTGGLGAALGLGMKQIPRSPVEDE